MRRLSQYEWDAILDYLQVHHVARLWMSGDPHVQSKIMHAKRRRVAIQGDSVHKSDLFNNILLNLAQDVDIDCIKFTDMNKAFDSPELIRNLKSLRLKSDLRWIHSVPDTQIVDLSHLRRLESFHITDKWLLKTHILVLPPSVTDATLCVTITADLSSLKSLTKMRILIDDARDVDKMDLKWPPSLLELEVKNRHSSVRSSLLPLLPPMLTRLKYSSSPLASVPLLRAIPPQCKFIQSLSLDCADFGIARTGLYPELPPSLTSLDVYSLLLSSPGLIDSLLAQIPPTVTTFSLDRLALFGEADFGASFEKERIKLMERLTAESAEMQVFRSNCGGPDVTDERAAAMKIFAEDAKRVLARKGLTHESYVKELLDVDIETVAQSVKRLPPSYGQRIVNLLGQFYGDDLDVPYLASNLPINAIESLCYLFEQGVATGLILIKVEDTLASMESLVRDTSIAYRLQRLHINGDDEWFAKLFPTDVQYPFLRRIALEDVSYAVATEVLFNAGRNLPTLNKVKLSPGETLHKIDHVMKMAALRLYGYTYLTTEFTVMKYYVSPPPYYQSQLKGELVDPLDYAPP